MLANVACRKQSQLVACWNVHTALPTRPEDLRVNLCANVLPRLVRNKP